MSVGDLLLNSRLPVAWMATGVALGAYEAALKYVINRKQFGRSIASFQLIQEKIARSMGLISSCMLLCTHTARLFMDENHQMAHMGLAKSTCTRMAREVCSLMREVCGGNGIVADYHVMKQMLDIEAIYTFEGTYEINSLIVGRFATGKQAFVH